MLRKWDVTSVDEDSGHYAGLIEMQNDTAAMENSMAVPQQVNHRIPIQHSNPISKCIPKELKAGPQTNTCAPVVMTILFTIANCSSTNDR